jgi:hypothetical protein
MPVWSEPTEAAKSNTGSWNMSSKSAVALVQMRSMVVSHWMPSPLQVGTPGGVARAKFCPMAHSSKLSAHGEGRMPGGDHIHEWVLKSPPIIVGMCGSISMLSMLFREVRWSML